MAKARGQPDLEENFPDISGLHLRTQASNKAGFAEIFYVDCLTFFAALSTKICKTTHTVDECSLDEELGRFYLWGESFRDGKLDMILENSPDLKNTVLKFITAVGSILLRSKSLRLSESFMANYM